MSVATEPEEIRQGGPRELEILWKDGQRSVYDVVYLRRACRCALCVDEWTGKRILEPGEVADDVRPVKMSPVGRYALSIHWSDGHSSGIYTFEYLRTLDSSDPRGESSQGTGDS